MAERELAALAEAVRVTLPEGDTEADAVPETVMLLLGDTEGVGEPVSETVDVTDIVMVSDMVGVTVIPVVDDHDPVRDNVAVTEPDKVGVLEGVGDSVPDVVTVNVTDTDGSLLEVALVVGLGVDEVDGLGLAKRIKNLPALMSTPELSGITA